MTIENNNPQFVGFIPHRLDIEERPELNDFPRNVLFADFYEQDGYVCSVSALYEPNFESYKHEGVERSLKYKNPYREEDVLTIIRGENGWSGQKEIRDEKVLFACGAEWGGFFTHLTMNGLSKGEACKFEKLFKVSEV